MWAGYRQRVETASDPGEIAAVGEAPGRVDSSAVRHHQRGVRRRIELNGSALPDAIHRSTESDSDERAGGGRCLRWIQVDEDGSGDGGDDGAEQAAQRPDDEVASCGPVDAGGWGRCGRRWFRSGRLMLDLVHGRALKYEPSLQPVG